MHRKQIHPYTTSNPYFQALLQLKSNKIVGYYGQQLVLFLGALRHDFLPRQEIKATLVKIKHQELEIHKQQQITGPGI